MPGPEMGTKYGRVCYLLRLIGHNTETHSLTDPQGRSQKPRCPPRWLLLRPLPLAAGCCLPPSLDTVSVRGGANDLVLD